MPSDYLTVARSAAQLATKDWFSGASALSVHTRRWLVARCDLNHPEMYFLHPQSLAILGFPWWLEESLRGAVDPGFQLDLMFSTINAYYFTRMLDDIMDGHAIERPAMPALYAFHMRFMQPYQRYFNHDHVFWREFERILMTTVEAVTAEASLEEITAEDFICFGARKQAAAAIPMAAVCARYAQPEILESWENILTLFARWHQMADDVVDWSSDMQSGQPTWLLTEAEARRNSDEPIAAWMGREGFRWAKTVMDGQMCETVDAASGLNNQALMSYLDERKELFSRQLSKMITRADAFAGLLAMDRL